VSIRLEKICFYFLIFCLPFQTRLILHQWGGEFNEWNSAYLYLTDILILLLLMLWLVRSRSFLKNIFLNKFLQPVVQLSVFRPPLLRLIGYSLVFFFMVSFISIIRAPYPFLALYQCFKLIEFILLFFYLIYNFNKFLTFKKFAQIIIASSLFQAFLAISQFVQQSDLGLHNFETGPLKTSIPGVAEIISRSVIILRPYGTFPHPNLLAIFLFFAIICLYYLIFKSASVGNQIKTINQTLILIVFAVLIFSLFLSFSRIVIFICSLTSFLFFAMFFRKRFNHFNKELLIVLFFVYLIIFISLWPELSSRFLFINGFLKDQSINLRVFYNQTAFSIIKSHPFLGIGYGNFVAELSLTKNLPFWALQPVHNIYLLLASETGLLGLMSFLLFISLILCVYLKKKNKSIENHIAIFLLGSFLFFGIFDHYFLTLQQGRLLFCFILSLIFFNNNEE